MTGASRVRAPRLRMRAPARPATASIGGAPNHRIDRRGAPRLDASGSQNARLRERVSRPHATATADARGRPRGMARGGWMGSATAVGKLVISPVDSAVCNVVGRAVWVGADIPGRATCMSGVPCCMLGQVAGGAVNWLWQPRVLWLDWSGSAGLAVGNGSSGAGQKRCGGDGANRGSAV
eukprot:6199770-Pleurochrysis_carterae.AAC.4